MNVSKRVAAVSMAAALLIGVAVWFFLKGTSVQTSASNATAVRLAAAKLALQEDLAPAKIVEMPMLLPARAKAPSLSSALRKRLAESTDLFAMYNELLAMQSVESKFLSARVLDFCAGFGKSYKGKSVEEYLRWANDQMKGKYIIQRQALLASQMSKSPILLCRDFPSPITSKMVEAAYDSAAEAGDIHGKLNQIRANLIEKATEKRDPNAPLSEADVAIVRQAAPNAPTGLPVSIVSMSVANASGPTPEQVDVLRAALWSKDPTQILFAGPVLTALYNDYELKFRGGETEDRTPSAMLWTSIACYFGNGYDANNLLVQRECVENARCDVGSYDQLLQRYHLVTEAEWNAFQKEREFFISVIESQNWGKL